MINTIQRAKVLDVRFLTPSTFVLRLLRNGFKFIPGQCVNIGLVGSAINREYSTYSGVNDEDLEFLIKKVTGGEVSTGLSKLKKGDEVTLDGSYGKFIIQNPGKKQKYMFIATGSGIAPFHSYVLTYPTIDYLLLHGVRNASEQYDRQDYERKRYISCVSREKGGDFSGRVTDYLKKSNLPLTTLYYLCGNKDMINDSYDILRQKGISGSNIFTEVFF